MLISREGKTLGTIGGGGMERLLIEKALETLKEGRPRTYHFAMGVLAREGMISVNSKCGGEVKIFMDPVKPEPRLIIFGSGSIAQAVSRYAKECGFEVIIVDDAVTATIDNFPGMIVINEEYPESLSHVKIRSSDYVAMLHGETRFELEGLRHILKAKPSYIGLLGSTKKAREHKKQLKAEGFDKDIVNAIKGPIGLEICAETPEEIGVSIVAELIQQKRGYKTIES